MISDVWAALEAEGRSEDGWHARRIHSHSSCDVRAAIRADGTKALLFEVLSKSIPPGADLPDCLGFHLVVETISPGPNGRGRLCLILKDRRFREVFAALCEDVSGAVAASVAEIVGVRALLGRLHTWERFITKFGPDRLSNEEVVGLFAELHFLKCEIISVLDPASAVRAWRGPYREPQDFRFRSVAIEIKASAARAPAGFRVANLDQLDPGIRELLMVHHVVLDANSTSGETVPRLIANIRASMTSVDAGAAADFDASLIEAGYLDIHSDSYEQPYSVHQARWFKVADTFPRMTRDNVMPGVTEASYGVSLEQCLPHMVDASVARTMLHKGF